MRVTAEDPTNNSCYFNRLGNISGCKMTKTERQGQVVSTSISYFSQPSSKQFIFTPKDLNSNLVLDFSCGTASGKYSIGSAICERPFDQIVGDLNANRHTLITDKSFREWAEDDRFDNCGFSLLKCNKKYPYPNPPYVNSPVKSANSGDKEDIMKNLGVRQVIANIPGALYFTEVTTREALEKVKRWTDLRRPYPLFFHYLGADNHVVIGLRIERKTGNQGQLANGYRIKYLDSNSTIDHDSFIKEADCDLKKFPENSTSSVKAYVCSSEDWPPSEFVPFSSPSQNFADDLITHFNNYCQTNSQSKFCQERYTNTTSWLENNYPPISNFSCSLGPKGICGGWVNFFLQVTYLGEFGYECPRPGSGSASTLKSLQLANIQDSINQIIEQIKALGLKSGN